MYSDIVKHLPEFGGYGRILSELEAMPEPERKGRLRNLCKMDLYFLLRYALARKDIEKKWLFDRCREVQEFPDGYLDLWSREHYKDLSDDTDVLTVDGWIKHGDLRVGDKVFSPSGKQVNVIALSHKYTDSECYEIEFSDGAKIVAGGGHLWKLRIKHTHRINKSDRRDVRFTEEVKSTSDLFKLNGRLDVGVACPLNFSDKDLPIAPYTLGAWLGDGSSREARITIHYDDLEILEGIRSEGYDVDERVSSNENTGLFIIDKGVRGKKGTGLTSKLRNCGVLNNKHIPLIYKTSGIEQRICLLRGLMDTDGHCNTRGTATFCNQNEILANDVYDLACGLGLRPRIRKYNGKHKFYWQVSFQAHLDRNPFNLKRKTKRAIKPSYYRGVRTIKSIVRVPSVPTRCIQVEGGMYLVGKELIPTHNSTILTYGKTIQDILDNSSITVGIFSHTRPIAKAFLRQIKREFEGNDFLKALFPDILYENPQRESVKWSEDDGIIVKRKTNPKEATVEAWGVVDGQPTSKHFDLLIYDDIVTKESVNTPEMIEKTTEALALSYNLGAMGGKRRFIGTRYHFNDTYRVLMERGTAKPRIYPATKNGKVDGEPVLLTKQQLEEKRRDFGPYTFSCQMLQNPVADSSQGFKREWLRHYDKISPLDFNWYLLVDAANGKRKENDYTAIWAVGLGMDGNYYCIPEVRDRLNLTERAKRVVELHRKYKPIEIRYEKYGLMADIEYIKLYQEQINYRFEITEVGGSMNKEDRIKQLIPLFENHRIYLPSAHYVTDYEGKQRNLIQNFIEDEYMAFPVSRHDDMLDSLARLVDKNKGTIQPAKKRVYQRVVNVNADQVIGY